MPPRIDRCVESLMKDPDFKPREPGQSKRDAAYALCTWLDQQGRLKESGEGMDVMDKSDLVLEGPFKVVLPIAVAKSEPGTGALFLRIRASGPERDSDGDRFSERGLERMVHYATQGLNGEPLQFLDGHYRDLLAAQLGKIAAPSLDEEGRFYVEVELDAENPFALKLFNDILGGKKHGASIAGIVHEAEIEEYEAEQFGRIFHDVELVEISRTSWPSYRPSFCTLLARSAGKVPLQEHDEVMKRRDELIEIRKTSTEGNEMSETTSGEEVLIQKLTSPHGWEKKFKVSGAPWSSVTNRSQPCQFCIIKKNQDGSFSSSKSGYPHHPPGCGSVNRGGVIAAAARLVQAMKAEIPELDLPPMDSMVEASIGMQEFEQYAAYTERVSRFSRAELTFAARHIIRHYRRDLEMTPPENLVSVSSKRSENEIEEILEVIKGLVSIIGKEANMPEKVSEIIEETPPVEEAVVEEPVVTEDNSEDETAEPELEAETVVQAEPPSDAATIEESALTEKVDARLFVRKFSELLYAMQELVAEALKKDNLPAALKIVDDFAEQGKNILESLHKGDVTPTSFLGAFEERIELADTKITVARVTKWNATKAALLRDLQGIDDIMAGVEGEVPDAPESVVPEETAKSELERLVDEKMASYEQRSQRIDEFVDDLINTPPTPEPVTRTQEVEMTVDDVLTPTQKHQANVQRFMKSVKPPRR